MTTNRSPKKVARWKDAVLVAAELLAKQVCWRFPAVRNFVKRRWAVAKPADQVCDHGAFRQYLREIGVTEGALVMAHTSIAGLRFTDEPATTADSPNVVSVASRLVDDLMELVGETGTLLMPTHAAYQSKYNYGIDAATSPPIVYNPVTTPCDVGLANELFRRRKGVLRSLYPYNMVAARGPLAEELLRDNLNDTKPLPHGVHSPYYRFCLRNGLVVSIGVPLGQCMTLVHTAEDVRDEQWPIKNFFEDRRYLVRIGGEDRSVTVRHQRPEYPMFCRCALKSVRDLVGEGIIHEGAVGTVRVDWAHSREVFEYLMSRNERKPYPFYFPWLVRSKR